MRLVIKLVCLSGLVGMLGACGGGSSRGSDSGVAASSAASSLPVSSPPVCPNDFGGLCRGTLQAGTYKTERFRPQISYTVPPGGWANEEDNYGSFVLAPPGVPSSQVENATNVIIVWPGVEAAKMDCSSQPDTSVATTAKAIAQWLSHHPGLASTKPQAVTIGGHRGYVLSVRLAPRGGVRCGAPFRNVPLFNNSNEDNVQIGIGGASDHALLYLLNMQDSALGIFADSTTPHRPSLAAEAKVIRSFHFTTG